MALEREERRKERRRKREERRRKREEGEEEKEEGKDQEKKMEEDVAATIGMEEEAEGAEEGEGEAGKRGERGEGEEEGAKKMEVEEEGEPSAHPIVAMPSIAEQQEVMVQKVLARNVSPEHELQLHLQWDLCNFMPIPIRELFLDAITRVRTFFFSFSFLFVF